MNPLTPIQSAEIAKFVYDLRNKSVTEFLRTGTLGCEGLFKVDDGSRFTGKSGGYAFRKLSGFGYMAEGEGVRQGEVLCRS